MFVLVWSDNELLASDNRVRTFTTHDDARAAMVEEFVDSLRCEGYEPVLPTDGGDVFDHDVKGLILGYMDDDWAYTEHCEEKWVIFEVPGLFVPQEDAGWVKACLRDFGVGQTNFEASEMALEVCNVLKSYV